MYTVNILLVDQYNVASIYTVATTKAEKKNPIYNPLAIALHQLLTFYMHICYTPNSISYITTSKRGVGLKVNLAFLAIGPQLGLWQGRVTLTLQEKEADQCSSVANNDIPCCTVTCRT